MVQIVIGFLPHLCQSFSNNSVIDCSSLKIQAECVTLDAIVNDEGSILYILPQGQETSTQDIISVQIQYSTHTRTFGEKCEAYL